ncbi:MAG: response regulator [Pirellulales bacterium]|nr:response regulator [Pirellulales bacterium]
MANILVVDDSTVDRHLVGGLLQEDLDWTIEYAADGAEALGKIELREPDLVVTDLVMPQLDGLELVTAVRGKHPLVPIILITSRGSEEIAVEALQRGAASYVSKRALGANLLDTVRRVLAVSSHRRSQSRLMECMTYSNSAFTLDNDSSLFGPLVTYLQEEVTQLGLCDETECTRIGVALEESLVNALYHGNLEVASELRERDDEAYGALVRQRRCETPYRDRRIYVEAALSRDQARVVVRDEGSGFDPSTLPDPTDPNNLERVSGRGVLLMRTFMDEVVYNDVGNSVTLTKRRNSNAAPVRCEDA